MPPRTKMNYDAAGRQPEFTYPYTASSNVCSRAENQYNGPVEINKGTITNNIQPVTLTNEPSYHFTFVSNGQAPTGTSSSCKKCDTDNPAGGDISRGSSKTTSTSDGRQISPLNSVDQAKYARIPHRVACSLRIGWINFIIRHLSLRAYGLLCGFLMW